MMPLSCRFLAATLLILAASGPALAQRSPTNTNLAEINHHQAGAAAALLLGNHTLLERGQVGVSGHVYVSGWGNDSIYGAPGLSFQAGIGRNIGVGLSYGYAEAQIHTRTWLLNFRFSPPETSGWLHLQAALGRQFLAASEAGNVTIFEFDDPWPIQPGNPQILLDDMTWTHGYLNILLDTRLWYFRPQTSLGLVLSRYSWSGRDTSAFGDPETAPAIADSGGVETIVWSLGLGLDLGAVQPFAGLSSFKDGGLFMARLTVVF
jgi:hypothetical protein